MSTSSLPKTVRAVLQPDIQSTDLILTELPLQQAKPNSNEHLIKVYATAPCAGELLWAKNFPSMFTEERKAVPCYDLSGVVITAPAESPFQPGAEIYTRTHTGTGHARDYTIAKTEELAIKPKGLSWTDSSSIPLSAFTAYQALFEHGGLKPAWKDPAGKSENSKKRVLITAPAGGVGVWVVQLAKAAGVKDIVGVSGPANIELVKSLGVTEIVNYKEQSLGQWAAAGGAKVDLVIDMLGNQTLSDAWTAVKDGAILLSIREPPEGKKPTEHAPKDVSASFFIMEPKGWQLKEVADLVERGEARPVVDSVWTLDQFKEAFAKAEGGHARGKVIITLQE
ncbi:NAD(P)-binding protein [Tothia fuscella]|uniref:NAD(P)-binding protein n=1 Tax=Tothia fuscella TaxID=1048955 RepID=A0A9P4TVJ7_9PEZI|nr:NAD(P)-binding protein [Tothia fuscella]